jgi:hypothetical protein
MTWYMARLTTIWGELEPKVTGRSNLKPASLEADFLAFRKYNFDPTLLMPPMEGEEHEAHTEDILKLHACIRQVLENLKITEW